MKTPWINHSDMHQICSKQMAVFISSPSKVQKLSIDLFLKYIEVKTESGNGIGELDTEPSCVDKVTTNNPHQKEGNDFKLVNYLDYKTNSAVKTKDTPQSDSTSEYLHPSESTFVTEKNELLDNEVAEEAITAEETKDTPQSGSTLVHLHPSESAFVAEKNELLNNEVTEETITAEETKDIPQSDSTLVHLHPSESAFVAEKNELLDNEVAEETITAEETKDTPQSDSTSEYLHPSESAFVAEKSELLDNEVAEETITAEETKDTPQSDSTLVHLHPSESAFVAEKNELLDNEVAEEAITAEETKDTPQSDSTLVHLHPSESAFVAEKNELLDNEVAEETITAEETKDIPQSDSTLVHLHPSESAFVAEKNELLDNEVAEETITAEETKDTPQSDSTLVHLHPSESAFVDVTKELLDNEQVVETNSEDSTSRFHNYEQGKICFMTKKSPFSIHVEIDNFLHAPICGEIVQNTFEFLDLNNKQPPEFDTKIFHTKTYYPEQPDCRLVCSEIHEIIFLTDTHTYDANNKNKYYKSAVVPLHDSIKTGETNNNSYTSHDFMHIRVPVVVGEYKIEIPLEENVVFEKEVMRIKKISKEVVLTNYKFIPTQFSQFGNGTCTVLKGNLFIEGYIHQDIEYTAFHDKDASSIQKKSATHLNQLCQKMQLELIIHLLQVQQVQVIYDGNGSKR